MDSKWTSVATSGQVTKERPAVASAHGVEIAIYQVGDRYFAISDTCTHDMARLLEGHLDGYLIRCPLHQGAFDIRNGGRVGGSVDVDLTGYDVRVVDEVIEVRPRGASLPCWE